MDYSAACNSFLHNTGSPGHKMETQQLKYQMNCPCRGRPLLWQHWGHDRVPAASRHQILLALRHATHLWGKRPHSAISGTQSDSPPCRFTSRPLCTFCSWLSFTAWRKAAPPWFTTTSPGSGPPSWAACSSSCRSCASRCSSWSRCAGWVSRRFSCWF